MKITAPRTRRKPVQRDDAFPSQTEAQFQQQVLVLARLLGWTYQYHAWRSDHSAAGFPDLVLLHPGRAEALFVECKALDRRGRPKPLTDEQAAWYGAMTMCGLRTRIWTPLDWDLIEETLRGI